MVLTTIIIIIITHYNFIIFVTEKSKRGLDLNRIGWIYPLIISGLYLDTIPLKLGIAAHSKVPKKCLADVLGRWWTTHEKRTCMENGTLPPLFKS
jgi:hypothetical protein